MTKMKRARKKSKKKKDRSAKYWLTRLKKVNPAIYADFFAGRYPSVNKACEAAGLKRRKAGLDVLKKVWGDSSASEQDAFLIWARPAPTEIMPRTPKPIVDASLCLSKEVRDFMAAWIFYKDSRAGRIMQELGFPSSDTRLSQAIKYGGPLGQEVIDELGPWLAKNGFVALVHPLGR